MPRKIKITEEHINQAKCRCYSKTIVNIVSFALDDLVRHELDYLRASATGYEQFESNSQVILRVTVSAPLKDQRLIIFSEIRVFECVDRMPKPFEIILHGLPGRIYAKNS